LSHISLLASMPDEEDSPMQKVGHACACCIGGWLVFPLTLWLLGSNEKSFVCNQKNILMGEAEAKITPCEGYPGDNKFVAVGCAINEESKREWTMKDFLTDATTAAKFSEGSPSASGTGFKFKSLTGEMSAPQMYQCKEDARSEQVDPSCKPTKDKNGKTISCPVHTVYSYSLDWSAGRASFQCSESKCQNDRKVSCPDLGTSDQNPFYPAGLPTVMETKWASNPFSFKIGNTGLYITDGDGGTRSRDFKADKPLPLSGMDWKRMGQRINSVLDKGKQSKFDYDHTTIVGNYIYTCDGNDVVHGCVRVSFSYNADVGAGFIGNTGVGGKTEPMIMPASWGCPKSTWFVTKRLASKADIKPGKEVKEDIIASQNAKNESSLYFFRVVGVLGCWAAVYCCLYPIVAFFDIMEDYMAMVPCIGGCLSVIGQVVETLVQLVVCCMSCSFGCSAAFFTIALVWLYMRPLQGILYMLGCLAVSGGAYALAHMAPKKEGKGQARDLNQELASAGGEQP